MASYARLVDEPLESKSAGGSVQERGQEHTRLALATPPTTGRNARLLEAATPKQSTSGATHTDSSVGPGSD